MSNKLAIGFLFASFAYGVGTLSFAAEKPVAGSDISDKYIEVIGHFELAKSLGQKAESFCNRMTGKNSNDYLFYHPYKNILRYVEPLVMTENRKRFSLQQFKESVKILNENNVVLTSSFHYLRGAQFFDYGNGRKALMIGGDYQSFFALVEELKKDNFSLPGKVKAVFHEDYKNPYIVNGNIGDALGVRADETSQSSKELNLLPC